MIVKGGFVHVAFALIKRITIIRKMELLYLKERQKGKRKIIRFMFRQHML